MPEKKSSDHYRLVYTSDKGAQCLMCGSPQDSCKCQQLRNERIKGDGNVKVRRETKGRAGKTVTTISGLAITESSLKDLLRALKKVCGSGGTVKDGVIEIQGDHCEKIITVLGKQGINAKRAGG